jgi:hypothetical protein
MELEHYNSIKGGNILTNLFCLGIRFRNQWHHLMSNDMPTYVVFTVLVPMAQLALDTRLICVSTLFNLTF